ncbi:cyclin N-terminal domain-containing protein 1 [Hippoglossus hippoglossus]|uniref:cyclin N-terminal domain-containing protein 1 n=1 Tax=Hippoglossus hippoglossus TaxID=8267 RepID=UPI00148D5828|nr:cyclin N-terminal domain-containing protein 1 [Hippoglossus hippoglossus]XP_034426852.1 cyclin N-terminal domain-containing protein 1 [Hippoglossus hippoglossus]
MAKRSSSHRFRETAGDLLSDALIDLNKRNKENLNSLSQNYTNFRDKRTCECIFFLTKELRLDPLVGYHAIELLQRFMVKHLTDLLTSPTLQTAAADRRDEDAVFDKIKDKFPVFVFTCVQLASKLCLYKDIITNKAAVHFLHSVGLSVSKQTLQESELMILKALDFRLNTPNPLTYIELLLEVLGHNEPSVPVEHLYDLCHHVLQFVSLGRAAIYDSLLKTTTRCNSPSREQREKFVTVTEDYMLLGVGVIAVATFILSVRKWEEVVAELSHITGISSRSIRDFTHVILMHIVRPSSPATPARVLMTHTY